jgi:methylated-DNA-[protein]-cysteine S-methyltransferase
MTISEYQAILAAPGFSLGICCTEDEITTIRFLPPQEVLRPATLLATEAARQLRVWLKDASYAFSLPLQPAGTLFQRRVWAGIAAIPASETLSYGELARRIGSAPRAVGNACGANPYPVVVPCHRVIASDGGLGGFGRDRSGFLLDVKRWLLMHEQR